MIHYVAGPFLVMFVDNTTLTASQLVIGHRIDVRDIALRYQYLYRIVIISFNVDHFDRYKECTYQNVVYKNLKFAF